MNTPRVATDAQQRVVWRWENTEPFGKSLPEEDPDGDGAQFEFNLRFPGQYFDKETGLHYSYFRDCYDPATGRFCQPDPIGLEDGVNLYLYAKASPLMFIDPDGLKAVMCCRLLDSTVLGTVGRQRHCYFNVDGTTYGLYPDGGIGVPRINDPRDRGGNCKECKPPKCSDVNSCIRDQHDFYPSGNYSATGPNSNTYAGTIARACCDGGVPPGLGSAPGINDSPPAGGSR
ncbi:MAG: RHS repeat-associated core domain-containing protein [Burkholderiales bacterium]